MAVRHRTLVCAGGIHHMLEGHDDEVSLWAEDGSWAVPLESYDAEHAEHAEHVDGDETEVPGENVHH